MPRSNPLPPSLNLLSSSSPARPVSTSPSSSYRQSQSPFRYVKELQMTNEKEVIEETPLSVVSEEKRRPFSPGVGSCQSHCALSSPLPRPASRSPEPSIHSRQPSPCLRTASPLLVSGCNRSASQSPKYTRPRGLRISNLLKPWIPLILYAITSFSFLVAVAFWKNEVFECEFQ